jgi:hypothetical protein
MRARLRLVGRLASPLQRPINVEFKIGATANSGYAIVFDVSRSSRSSVRLQVPTKFGVADELVLCKIEPGWIVTFSHWRQVIPTGMSASFVVPVSPDFQDVIQVLLVDDAKAVQHLVLECLDDAFDERL